MEILYHLGIYNRCGDDNDFTFNYTDSIDSAQKATKCSDISELTPIGVKTKVCKKSYRYPTSKSDKKAISKICARQCGMCPDTEAPLYTPSQTPSVYE